MDNLFTYHHVGIAVRDLQSAIPAYERLFGYKLISGPFSDAVHNVTICFMSRGNGDPVIELVAPIGPNSPLDRILKRGGGAYHLCYEVSDLRKAIDELRAHGAFLISEPAPAVAFEMREIAWMMTDEASLLVELVQAR